MIRLTNLQYAVLCLLFFNIHTNSLEIPENPCPNVFRYKKSGNGEIYGEAVVPYDGNKTLEFTISASLTGYFENVVRNFSLLFKWGKMLKIQKNLI